MADPASPDTVDGADGALTPTPADMAPRALSPGPLLTTRSDRPPSPRPPPAPSHENGHGHGPALPRLQEVVGPGINIRRSLLPQAKALPRPVYITSYTTVYLDDQPVRTYTIGGHRYNMAQPPNETTSTAVRRAVDGRAISYKLEVVQQPEKARACGSGPRSSADRRPVDPPPVIELRVFDGQTDITMRHDATFMLYASLEVARPIANGRMQTPATNIPVLAGVCVASAAYLDKPRKAAYFIFPDLSVRHEGWYRLKFSLFEGVKHEMDADMGKPFQHALPAHQQQLSAPLRHESMANRLEVRSVPFQVYSAKKFPGLNSSTSLSQLVADQGCRVRIRREIRQRKRAKKVDGDDADAAVSSYHGTPQPSPVRLEHAQPVKQGRSDSHGSYHDTPQPSPDYHRGHSAAPYGQHPADGSRPTSRNSHGSPVEAEILRKASIESIYGRSAAPGRPPATAIAGAPFSSPSQPSTTANPAAMAPPTMYQMLSTPQSIPQPVPQPVHAPLMCSGPGSLPSPRARDFNLPVTSLPAILSPSRPDDNLTLPPIQFNSSAYTPTRRYELPSPTASKRAFHPPAYEHGSALKSGARPDPMRPPPYATSSRDIIEADSNTSGAGGGDSDGSDSYMDLTYARANGSRSQKPVYRVPVLR